MLHGMLKCWQVVNTFTLKCCFISVQAVWSGAGRQSCQGTKKTGSKEGQESGQEKRGKSALHWQKKGSKKKFGKNHFSTTSRLWEFARHLNIRMHTNASLYMQGIPDRSLFT